MLAQSSFGQQKEILIIGTMHTVPVIVKNSYKPLLKYAKKYNPEAIYVERVRSTDTISLNYYYKRFLKESDSLKGVFQLDNDRFKKLMISDLETLSEDDFNFMSKSFLVRRDKANYYYYKYLKKFGVEGSKKPLRNENGDLTSKLAIYLNIKYIHSMDDQQTNKEYHTSWSNCVKIGAKNGDNLINNKLNKKDYNSSVIPSIFGRLGKHANKPKSLNRLHQLNSFRYVSNPSTSCSNAMKYWDERNMRMAQSIAEQVIEKPFLKSIVIVGAGHVIGIKQELEKNHPELKIKLIYESKKQ